MNFDRLMDWQARRARLSLISLVDAAIVRRSAEAGAQTDTPRPLYGEALRAGRLDLAAATAELDLRAAGLSTADIKRMRHIPGLDAADCLAAVAIGIIGAILPSIDLALGQGAPGHPIAIKDILQRGQDHEIKRAVESILRTDSTSAVIDHVGGFLHRFAYGDPSHDPIAVLTSVVASAIGVPPLVAEPAVRILAHLLIDASGATGIPFPGSSYLRHFLGELLGGDPLGPRGASRYLGYRHSDLFAAGSTSLLLFLYEKSRRVTAGSARSYKLAITAHGVSTITMLGVAAAGSAAGSFGTLRLVARRSHINYVSGTMMLKNAAQLAARTQQSRVTSLRVEASADSRLRPLNLKSEEEIPWVL